MIHAIAIALSRELAAVKCPLPVIVGPELSDSNITHERIVVSPAADSFGPSRSQTANAKQRMTRVVGGTITIYAQSTAPGAVPAEHDDRVDAVLDCVLCAMALIARKRGVAWSPKSGGAADDVDLAKSAVPRGAKYVLNFTIDRGVYDRTFKGEEAATATIGAGTLQSTTRVFPPGVDPNEATGEVETSCGGGA